jgi:hypothetical protein
MAVLLVSSMAPSLRIAPTGGVAALVRHRLSQARLSWRLVRESSVPGIGELVRQVLSQALHR